ncbi:hypothetical protein KY289_001502 [Solanum tuberosum]|nr:hypothetical protein KY289_001502 [Solanum tuberosum]
MGFEGGKAKKKTVQGGTKTKKDNEANNEKRGEDQYNNERFQERRQDRGGPMKKKTNQVWYKVGVITTNKYDALQENEEE